MYSSIIGFIVASAKYPVIYGLIGHPALYLTVKCLGSKGNILHSSTQGFKMLFHSRYGINPSNAAIAFHIARWKRGSADSKTFSVQPFRRRMAAFWIYASGLKSAIWVSIYVPFWNSMWSRLEHVHESWPSDSFVSFLFSEWHIADDPVQCWGGPDPNIQELSCIALIIPKSCFPYSRGRSSFCWSLYLRILLVFGLDFIFTGLIHLFHDLKSRSVLKVNKGWDGGCRIGLNVVQWLFIDFSTLLLSAFLLHILSLLAVAALFCWCLLFS